MKRLKYFLILIAILVILYFLYGFYDSKSTVSIDNGVSSNTKGPISKEIETPIAKKKTTDFTVNLASETIVPESDTQLSYLQAYRNTVFFLKCNEVVNDINNNISPIIQFKNDASFDLIASTKESTKQASDLQLQYFSDFTQRCQSLMINNHETYYNARIKLIKKFNGIKPLTDQEKNLSKGLVLLNSLKEAKSQHLKARIGQSILDETEIKNIKTEIQNIQTRLREYYGYPDRQTNEQIQNIIKELNKKSNELYDRLLNETIIDPEQIQKFEDQIIQLNIDMVEFLKQNNSPDILLLFAPQIFHPKTSKHDTIIHRMKHDLKTYEPDLMLNLYNVGIKLAACAMNYPCDDQSEFISDYCIRGFNNLNNYPSACGKTLEDFYFNDYLGPNQLEDVSLYLNYILEHYAKQ